MTRVLNQPSAIWAHSRLRCGWLPRPRADHLLHHGVFATASNPVRRPCPGRSLQPPPRVVTASIGRYGRHFGASVGDLWRHAVARPIRTEPKSVFKTTRHGPAWQGTSRRLSLSKSGVSTSCGAPNWALAAAVMASVLVAYLLGRPRGRAGLSSGLHVVCPIRLSVGGCEE